MSKKPGGKKPKRQREPHFPLRFDSDELRAALERYAEQRRQSLNAAILTLLEEGLRASGHLKKPTTDPPTTT